MRQPWEYYPIAVSIERCPVASSQCVRNECKEGCSIVVPYPRDEPEPVLTPAELTLIERLARLFERT